MAAASDRHRHRTARRHSKHHLRHLGAVYLCPVPAGDLAAVFDQYARQCAPGSDRCLPGRLTAFGMLTSGIDPRHHGAAVRNLDHPRRVRGGARRVERGGLWSRLHDLGSRAQRGPALCPSGCHRRRHAGARAGARRNHGGHLRHRQRPSNIGLGAGAWDHHLRHNRQRIHRSGRRFVHLGADRAWADPFRHYLHRTRAGPLHADAPSNAGLDDAMAGDDFAVVRLFRPPPLQYDSDRAGLCGNRLRLGVAGADSGRAVVEGVQRLVPSPCSPK